MKDNLGEVEEVEKKSHQFQVHLCQEAITKREENSLEDFTNYIDEVIKMMLTNGSINT